MILANTLSDDDAAYLYAQSNMYYLRTGKFLYRMVLSGSRQEQEQALSRGKVAIAGRSNLEVVQTYIGALAGVVVPVLRSAGLEG